MAGAVSGLVYRLAGVRKEYGGRYVLNVEQLDILKGEVLAIVGPSGAGKSTLLRLLNFLESPSDGELSFLGNRFTRHEQAPLALRRQVTTVFQRPLLLNRSVWDNVSFGLKLRGIREWRQRTAAGLERVGLTHLSHERAASLSGGEVQRAALARALVLEPEVLLLDEPTANLDPYNVGLIEEVIRQINREQNTTLVLVTHNVFQARRLATRAALLLDGQVVELAETGRFFEAPCDPRTAAFVRGEMVY